MFERTISYLKTASVSAFETAAHSCKTVVGSTFIFSKLFCRFLRQ